MLRKRRVCWHRSVHFTQGSSELRGRGEKFEMPARKIPTLRKHRSGWGTRKGKIENKRLTSASASAALAGVPQRTSPGSAVPRSLFLEMLHSQTNHFGIIPIVRSHVSTNCGQFVIGRFVRRRPKACPP